jgi:diguanylate cyclase (GGDEF)-like protein
MARTSNARTRSLNPDENVGSQTGSFNLVELRAGIDRNAPTTHLVLRIAASDQAYGYCVVEPDGITRIGREPGLEFRIPDPSVSRWHATIELEDDGTAFVTDRGSTNGTSVNGTRVEKSRVPLRVGDRLEIGLVALRLDRLTNSEIEHLDWTNDRVHIADFDALTGLLQRGWVEGELPVTVRKHRDAGRPLACMLLDIDHFKVINDTYGHPVGDEVLRNVADIIKRTIRCADAARYGGEEFLIVAGCDADGAWRVAERVRKAIATHNWGSIGLERNVTASLGASMLTNEDSIDDWIARADRALYTAKRTGRNRAMVE